MKALQTLNTLLITTYFGLMVYDRLSSGPKNQLANVPTAPSFVATEDQALTKLKENFGEAFLQKFHEIRDRLSQMEQRPLSVQEVFAYLKNVLKVPELQNFSI